MKKIIRILVLATLLSIMFVCYAFADTINIPSDYATIQQGINAANDGDIVLVQPGTYTENINFNGKNITVASLFLTTQDTSYISQTIIDGNENGSVVTFNSEEDTTSVLCGFTITNGDACGDGWPDNIGGGILCWIRSSPTLNNLIVVNNSAYDGGGIFCGWETSTNIENVIIKENIADHRGGGIYCYHSTVSIEDVIIKENNADSNGGGIICLSSSPVLRDVKIIGNSTDWRGGGVYCETSTPYLKRVSIINNYSEAGGGISCYFNSTISLENVIIINNVANDVGSGICSLDNCSLNIVNSIVSDNEGTHCIHVVYGNTTTIAYSNFYNNQGGNFYGVNPSIGVNVTTNANGDSCDAYYNIQFDPLFVDAFNGDYHLSWANYPIADSTKSPCIDAGDPSSPLDPDGTIADMGAFYFNQNVSIDEPAQTSEFNLTNYPNPINSNLNNLTVNFNILKPGRVTIQIFNIKGQLVSTLINEDKNVGEYTIAYPVNELSSGIYFTRMSIDGVGKEVKKVILLR